MWELDCKESWVWKNWYFWTVVLVKTLESPLGNEEIQAVHPKRMSPEYSLERLMLKLKVLACCSPWSCKVSHTTERLNWTELNWLFATPWTPACQASPSIIKSGSLLKLMSIESVMPSNHLILCRPLLLLPSMLSQHQDLFQWVRSSHQVARVLELQLQHQSLQWIFRVDSLWDRLVGSCNTRDALPYLSVTEFLLPNCLIYYNAAKSLMEFNAATLSYGIFFFKKLIFIGV